MRGNTAILPLAAAAAKRALSRRLHGGITEKKEMTYILGPDLPDVWTPSISRPPATVDKQDRTLKILHGRAIAEDIRSRVACNVALMRAAVGKVPGLAIILVGSRKDSDSFVRYKMNACTKVGMKSFLTELRDGSSEDEIVDVVSRFNDDPLVHGILVQLPLPRYVDEERVLGAVRLEKDVDGFHPLNVGNLARSGGEPLFVPCAAKACVELLVQSEVNLCGTHVAIVGRSKVAGVPTSLILQRHQATVSIVHAFTKNPDDVTRGADVVIAAADIPNLVRGSWIKSGAVVIDVGNNLVEDPACCQWREHHHIRGDVCFEEVCKVASVVSPVPGGVGPVTIAMLLVNTLQAAERACGFST